VNSTNVGLEISAVEVQRRETGILDYAAARLGSLPLAQIWLVELKQRYDESQATSRPNRRVVRRQKTLDDATSSARRANRISALAAVVALLSYSPQGSILSSSLRTVREWKQAPNDCKGGSPFIDSDRVAELRSWPTKLESVDLRTIRTAGALSEVFGRPRFDRTFPANPFCVDRVYEYSAERSTMSAYLNGEDVVLLAIETRTSKPLVITTEILTNDSKNVSAGVISTSESANELEELRVQSRLARRVKLNETSFDQIAIDGLDNSDQPTDSAGVEEVFFGDSLDAFNYGLFGVSSTVRYSSSSPELVAFGVQSQMSNEPIQYLQSNGFSDAEFLERQTSCRERVSALSRYKRQAFREVCRYPISWSSAESSRLLQDEGFLSTLRKSQANYLLVAHGDLADTGIEGIFWTFGDESRWSEGDRRRLCFTDCFNKSDYGKLRR
jgi:hypothetical protein